ncbi:MAG: RpiB/LacA/LacB family sugar-phosphate isomerase [Gemmataceae bacterium]
MSGTTQVNGAATNGRVLTWPRRVLSVNDLRTSLNGHHEVLVGADTVVTPLAVEELRGRGVEVRRQTTAVKTDGPAWGFGQDRPHGMVRSAVQALARDGLHLRELSLVGDGLPCRWARAVAECLARGECAGGVLFCDDPGLVACVANKVAGLRAVSVTTVAQATRATLNLAANLLVVEMPGRTFFEIRQILRTLCGNVLTCPDGVACTLKELDGHAHRPGDR